MDKGRSTINSGPILSEPSALQTGTRPTIKWETEHGFGSLLLLPCFLVYSRRLYNISLAIFIYLFIYIYIYLFVCFSSFLWNGAVQDVELFDCWRKTRLWAQLLKFIFVENIFLLLLIFFSFFLFSLSLFAIVSVW
jgi:hypothetical protein